jgi:hypothetical protein
MRTHKTLSGLLRATDRLIAELFRVRELDARSDAEYARRAKALHAELNALWTNPADVVACKAKSHDLSDALYYARSR